MGELKHKFREGFKAFKNKCKSKIFPTTFMLVSPVLFAFISWEQAIPGLIMGA
jgi:hypothetical protein